MYTPSLHLSTKVAVRHSGLVALGPNWISANPSRVTLAVQCPLLRDCTVTAAPVSTVSPPTNTVNMHMCILSPLPFRSIHRPPLSLHQDGLGTVSTYIYMPAETVPPLLRRRKGLKGSATEETTR